MTDHPTPSENMFLTTPLGALYAKTATPIILVMMTNGLFTVVDGWFIGKFIGEDAFSAVTMVFPLFMMLIALGTLVSSGFSSVLARYLGAGNWALAEESTVSALALSAVICSILIGSYAAFGTDLIALIANGSATLAVLGDEYMSLVILFSPLFFIGAMMGDSFRCQGKLGIMTTITLLATFLNIVFNYFLIVVFEMGVAGTAYGTALAQAGSALAAVMYQYSSHENLHFKLRKLSGIWHNWGQYLALGAPTSLSYIGISASAAATLYQLQTWNTDGYEISVAAYGIVTRVMTFGFMPLLGLTLAQQAIVGNNFGAKNWDRSIQSLRISVFVATVYCGFLQVLFFAMPDVIAGIFVEDAAVILETARILPLTTLLYFLFGPLLMFPGFFQAIGDAKRSALLGLTKIYLFAIPAILLFPSLIGQTGIWFASPLADTLALLLTALVLYQSWKPTRDWADFLQARA